MRRGIKQTRWQRLFAFVVGIPHAIVAAFKGFFLRRKVRQLDSPIRAEAKEAFAKIIHQTELAPDCIIAGEHDGSPMFKVKHDNAWELFLHNSYEEAAEKVIEWANLQGDEVSTAKTSNMNREQRRKFAAKVRLDRKHNRGR
jgi:hypothetical protein